MHRLTVGYDAGDMTLRVGGTLYVSLRISRLRNRLVSPLFEFRPLAMVMVLKVTNPATVSDSSADRLMGFLAFVCAGCSACIFVNEATDGRAPLTKWYHLTYLD